MEKKTFDLLIRVLERLHNHGVLNHLILIGSWCNLLYKDYFKSEEYISTFRTRDVDFYIKKPI